MTKDWPAFPGREARVNESVAGMTFREYAAVHILANTDPALAPESWLVERAITLATALADQFAKEYDHS